MQLRITTLLSLALLCGEAFAAGQEYLVRFRDSHESTRQSFTERHGGQLSLVSREGGIFKWTAPAGRDFPTLRDTSLSLIQKNFVYRIPESPALRAQKEELLRAINLLGVSERGRARPSRDNPPIQSPPLQASGTDPLLSQAWGMAAMGALAAHLSHPQGRDIVVAVTDSGVDYNHQDLIHNMWRNPKEIPNDGIDNDGNGYVDDVVGWDFAYNDNKPYDYTLNLFEVLLGGGNPGHGTHVAGVIAAQANNARGIAGVAPQARIMALRFITERGQGSTEAAIRAIDYAVANGAHIINASWGSEARDEPDVALQEAIRRAEEKGVLFVAAAGNGRKGTGFDNDSDPRPMVPATYDFPNLISVAAIDAEGNLAPFSNWGAKSVHVAAPGVKILSTVPGNGYQDALINFGPIEVTWDGTSMAAPFVAGALAVLWSGAPDDSMSTVRNRLLSLTVPTAALSGKVATGGRLNLE